MRIASKRPLAKRVMAIDISPNLVARATAEEIRETLSFVVGDIVALDLEKKFDVVCLFDVLEHIPLNELSRAMTCIGRPLDKNGVATNTTKPVQQERLRLRETCV